MCGICGVANGDRADVVPPALVRSMCGVMVHRGPDDEGRTVIVFNGEIYNYLELRDELAARGHRFRTRSDTEVILRLYEDRGEACLDALDGMFAIAIWDGARRTLFLARDRLGEKPLHSRTSAA